MVTQKSSNHAHDAAGKEEGGAHSGKGKGGASRRKVCRFCAAAGIAIDYKDQHTLKMFITDRGKILPRRLSGNCANHQRKVAQAVRRARILALLPFTVIGE